MSEGAVEKLKEQRLRLQKEMEGGPNLERIHEKRVADQIREVTDYLDISPGTASGRIDCRYALYPETVTALKHAGFEMYQTGRCWHIVFRKLNQ